MDLLTFCFDKINQEIATEVPQLGFQGSLASFLQNNIVYTKFTIYVTSISFLPDDAMF